MSKGDSSFKICPLCRFEWRFRQNFLADPDVKLVGYQVNFGDLAAGYFLFNHLIPACGTTLSIPAGEFADLYDGPIFEKRLDGTKKCPDRCLRQDDLRPCAEECECAYVREILQIVKKWPKHK